MKNALFLFLFFASFFNLEATKSNSCVGDNCQTENPDIIDISEFQKRDVFEALYLRACKNNPTSFFNEKYYTLTEHDLKFLEYTKEWKDIDDWKGCYMWVDLSQDWVNVEFFNAIYGEGEAQKAINKLKKTKVLLS